MSSKGAVAAAFWPMEIEALMESQTKKRGLPISDKDVELITYDFYERSRSRTALDVQHTPTIQNQVNHGMAW